MSYQVLARKWRPRSFRELTGQEHVSKTLENEIKAGRIAHAYLFSGVRGVGKTSVARILAKSLNCTEGPTQEPCMKCQSCVDIAGGFSVDLVEIDGASNTGVDNVRELQENAQYAPLRGRYKIYIIDEVHMLSTSAFNALLKILEEPPPHVIFIFATTEPHKIPNTIHSRCQHFQFRRISYMEIMERLQYILGEEGIEASEDALSLVARASEGSLRDALSLLDQVIGYTDGNLAEGDVTWILGLADHLIGPFMQHILNRDAASALSLLKDIADGGYDLKQFCANTVEFIRNLTMAGLGLGRDVLDLPKERVEEMVRMAEGLSTDDLQRLFGIFSKALEEMRWFPYIRFSFEMAVVKAANLRPVVSIEGILDKLAVMENRLSTGISHVNPPVNPDVNSDDKKKGRHGSMAHTVEPESRIKPEPAPSETVEKAGAADGEDSLTSDISVLWHKVVREVNGIKPSLGSYLEQGVPVGNEDGVLSVGFNGGATVFINLIERKESKDLILKSVKNHIPGVVGIKFITAEGSDNNSPAYSEYLAKTHERQQHEVEDAFSEPIVKEAIDILNGELIELRSRKDA